MSMKQDEAHREKLRRERETKALLKAIGTLIGLAALVAGGIAWAWFQWAECRDLGHTVFYCINHTFG